MKNIEQRKSVRTFTGEKLKDEHVSVIKEYLTDEKNLTGISGNKIEIVFRENGRKIGGKIGTYGFIKNAPAFLVIICKNDKESLLDVGYIFEKMVLYLETLGLGTCWLGGTFRRSQFSVDTKGGYFIPAISPVGYSAQMRSLTDKIVRSLAKGDSRIEFDQLFFEENFNTSVKDMKIRKILEMVRLAPSASNKQPWRVVMYPSGAAHFFIQRTSGYAKSLSYDIQWLDMGIALAHYELASEKKNYNFENPNIDMHSDHQEYVISVS